MTVGSTEGGGGGREARVNWISNANVVWEAIMTGVKEGDPEYEVMERFWGENIPEEEWLAGLPYQGALLQTAVNPPSWLKRTQELIKTRYKEAKETSIPIHRRETYRFGSVNGEAVIGF